MRARFVFLAASLSLTLSTACGGGGESGGGDGESGGSGGGASNGSGACSASSSSGSGGSDALVTYGDPFEGGQFHLGPIDYDETQFHNACAPGSKYAGAVRSVESTLLAGLWSEVPDVAGLCDACIWVTTEMGKSAMLRVVTYGDTSNNSIDTSPEAFAILDSGEFPRSMTWQLARCPDTGPMMYEFQTGANEWWTSLWVRNARVPLAKVEVQSQNHASWVALDRGGDGTLTDGSGFGAGKFSIRSTGIDGQEVVEAFDWPEGGIAGALITGKGNFH